MKKRGGFLLKRELSDLSYLQSHPEVQRYFLNAGCLEFVNRLQNGHHQATAEAFALSFDGNRARVGSVEIKVDEKFIAEATGLPMTGEKWFKTTAPKKQDYKFYLKDGYKHKAWTKGMLVAYLDEEWQHLFKGIQLYVTSEGRYDKLMMYHFKLMDHFSGKIPISLPYFLYHSLVKVCNRIRTRPSSIKSTLCHTGLIKLIILQQLKIQERSWEHFLFWEGFETQNQATVEQMLGLRKTASPQSSIRRRRAIPAPSEDEVTESKPHSLKRKLEFEQVSEPIVQQDSCYPTQQSSGKRHLNLSSSDSGSEKKVQSPTIKGSEQAAEFTQNYDAMSKMEQGESSKKSRSNKTHRIKHLKEVIAQQEVLERVIKERYKRLSDNFAQTNATLDKLAKQSIKEKRKKEKLINNCSKLKLLVRHLRRRIKIIKRKLKQGSHPDLQVLAQVAVNMQAERSGVD
jgi:archaellum component FlaC